MANSNDDMDKPVTKRELYEALEVWGGALEARADAKLGVLEARLETKLETKLDLKLDAFRDEVRVQLKHLSVELAQHANRIIDTMKEMVGVVDEKYNDLPGRVAVLEAKVLPPRRQRRR